MGQKKKEVTRRSLYKVVNREKRIIINRIKERGWIILN